MGRLTGLVKRNRGKHAYDSLFLNGLEIPCELSFSIAQNATQFGTEVEISVCNKDGIVIPGVHTLDVYLSDTVNGVGVTAVDPFGAVTAKAASGTVLGILTAKKAFRVTTLATGKFTLQIIDDVTPVFLYVAASIPSLGLVQVSRKTVAGDYKP